MNVLLSVFEFTTYSYTINIICVQQLNYIKLISQLGVFSPSGLAIFYLVHSCLLGALGTLPDRVDIGIPNYTIQNNSN